MRTHRWALTRAVSRLVTLAVSRRRAAILAASALYLVIAVRHIESRERADAACYAMLAASS